MNDFPEAIGELAQGGLIARALEPAAGEVSDGHTHESACLNCGTPLLGSHCHGCGQRGHVHRTMAAFLHDLLHGVLHFEGKTWRTLPLLVLRPGELTRRYIAGERARFVSPMALFLFSVFLMFAVFQLVGIGAPTEFGTPVSIASNDGETLERQLAGLRRGRQEIGDDNPAAAIIDGQMAALENRIEETRDPDGKVVLMENEDKGSRLTYEPTGIALLDHGIEKWRQNPGLMAYKLQANSYKFSWLLIPLSVPFVWLIFAWKRRFGAYDHAVFVTYSLCFMSLLFVTIAALGQVPAVSGALLFFAAVLIPPVHIYKQLRGAYSLTRFSAFWRTTVLLVFITVILTLFVNLLLVLGAMG
jgi:hypothetical protein